MSRDRTKVLVEGYEVMWVRITGVKATREERSKFDLPLCPNDKGLVTRFHHWMNEEDVLPLRSLTSGGGVYSGLFEIQDGEKAVRWLNEQLEEMGER